MTAAITKAAPSALKKLLVVFVLYATTESVRALPTFDGTYEGKIIVSFKEDGAKYESRKSGSGVASPPVEDPDFKSVIPSTGFAFFNAITNFFYLEVMPKTSATGSLRFTVNPDTATVEIDYRTIAKLVVKKTGKPTRELDIQSVALEVDRGSTSGRAIETADKRPKRLRKRVIINATGGRIADSSGATSFAIPGKLKKSPATISGTIGPGKDGRLEVNVVARPKNDKRAGFERKVRIQFIESDKN